MLALQQDASQKSPNFYLSLTNLMYHHSALWRQLYAGILSKVLWKDTIHDRHSTAFLQNSKEQHIPVSKRVS
jgi:hypothetical protein